MLNFEPDSNTRYNDKQFCKQCWSVTICVNPRRVFIDSRNKYHREKYDIDYNQSTECTDGHQEIKCL